MHNGPGSQRDAWALLPALAVDKAVLRVVARSVLELKSYPEQIVGGGCKYFIFPYQCIYIYIYLGEDSHISISIWGRFPFWLILTHIFQVGWFNHQLELPSSSWLCLRFVLNMFYHGEINMKRPFEQVSNEKKTWLFSCILYILHTPLGVCTADFVDSALRVNF